MNGYDTMKKNRVMVAMSGGVDSSVAAYLLKQQQYDICGVTLKLFDNDDISESADKTCCSLSDIEDARSVAFNLDIPYYVFNFGDRFKKDVIDRFIQSYRAGRTPNPCIDCNRYIKFDKLLQRADELNYGYIATGHYAVIEKQGDRVILRKAADHTKDQSYVLYSLTQSQLKKVLFPLGSLTKAEVRDIANGIGLVTFNKPDSQDICFVKDGKYAEFIEEYTGAESLPGQFLNKSGDVLGTHKGIIHYTIGQRRGLNLATGNRIYVCGINASDNTVIVGEEKELYKKAFDVSDINLIALDRIDSPLRVKVKTRYKQTEQPATVLQTGENRIHVEFDEPQRSVTSGQAAVFYDGDIVIGGGTIE